MINKHTTKRAIVIVLDSFGIGALPDASKFGDAGADTLGHIDDYCKNNKTPFNIPNLLKLGLGEAYFLANQKRLHIDQQLPTKGYYAACKELSSGKDTTSGHWEIAGVPVLFDWGYFSDKVDSFPPELLHQIVEKSGINGFLGNCHASGTEIIKQLGQEHISSGKPIFYTSADSVFQIACHEKYFGLEELYKLCEIVREELAPYNIARVIARPFDGETPESFARTKNRKDYSLTPNEATILEKCKNQGGEVIAIGKIGDIYAHVGTTQEIKASGIDELCDKTIEAIVRNDSGNPSIIMTNLVDFDMLYGHRRDVLGYKTALEQFDKKIPKLLDSLKEDDLLILTADHGCDPTWPGSDHTREYIPFLAYHKNIDRANNPKRLNLGIKNSFSDIGSYIMHHLSI
jgi:phosphopentomutase